MLLIAVSYAAWMRIPALAQSTTPMRPPTGTPTPTWSLGGGPDTETVTSTVASQQGEGQIYYVATDGSDSNPGTEAQPFRTISKGVSVLGPGDTVYVRQGTYHEQVAISSSGDDGLPITVSAYPGESPVIDGQNSLPGAGRGLVDISGDYIVFDGFEIRNSAYVGARVAGDFAEAHNLYVHHSYEHGILIQGTGNLVEGCEVWWNSTRAEYGDYSGWWSAGLSAARHPSNATIRNNVVHQNWGEGLSAFEADHITIEDNVVYDNWTANVYISDATDVLLQRNLVYGVPGSAVDQTGRLSAGIALADEQSVPDSRGITIINNVVVNCHWSLYWWLHVSGSGLKDSLIAHNTFANSRHVNFQIEGGNHLDTRIENNIIFQDFGLIASAPNDPDLHFSHNLWSRVPPPSTSGPGDVLGDPQFVDASAYDFHLQPTSPAIDAGIALSEVPDDFDTVPRPYGAGYDIGAYESPSPAELAKVTDLRVVAAVGDTPSLTLTLRWTAPIAAVTYTLRSSNTRLTADNWSGAPLLVTMPFTASEPGSSEWLTTPVDYAGDTLYLALKYQSAEGAWSALSNNAFWSEIDIYLPLILKDYVSSSRSSYRHTVCRNLLKIREDAPS